MTRPWVLYCPEGVSPHDVGAIQDLLPGDHGILVVPSGVSVGTTLPTEGVTEDPMDTLRAEVRALRAEQKERLHDLNQAFATIRELSAQVRALTQWRLQTFNIRE